MADIDPNPDLPPPPNSQLRSKIASELSLALTLLESHKQRALQIISQQYDSEARKTKQLAHAYDLSLSKHTLSLDGLIKAVAAPAILYAKCSDNEPELVTVVKKTCYRNPLSLEEYIDLLEGNECEVVREMQAEARENALGSSTSRLHYACQASFLLSHSSAEFSSLHCSLSSKLLAGAHSRLKKLSQSLSGDSDSISRCLKSRLPEVFTQHTNGLLQPAVSACKDMLQLALPHSSSKLTARTMWELAVMLRSLGQDEAERHYDEALSIVMTGYQSDNITPLYAYKLAKNRNKDEAFREVVRSGKTVCVWPQRNSFKRALVFEAIGLSLIKLKQVPSAEKAFSKAIATCFDSKPQHTPKVLIALRRVYA